MKTEKRMTVLYSERMLLGASLIFAATNVMGAVDSSPVSHVDAVESILQQKEISGTVVMVRGNLLSVRMLLSRARRTVRLLTWMENSH